MHPTLPRTARATFTVFVLFVAGVLSGAYAGSKAADRARAPYASLDTLVRVLGLVEQSYVDEIPMERLVDASIRGLLNELDPHTSWMSPDAWRDLQRATHGAYAGIGVDIEVGDVGAVVTRVHPGSPASRDGLTVGDTIVAIDGRAILGEPEDAILSALIGPRGEPANLEILRSGAAERATVQTLRDVVHASAVDLQMAAPGVAYARVVQFQEGAAAELRRGVERLLRKGPLNSLVLDLRDNPGGLLSEAVAVTDLFLRDGLIVSTDGRLSSEQRSFAATSDALPDDLRLVVLINGMSASASEIVAAALQDRGRATLVGTRTYGKGSVQTLYEHRDGSAIKLTVARYFTPSGEPVARIEGRKPDVRVPWPSVSKPNDALIAALETAELDEPTRQQLLQLATEAAQVGPRKPSAIPWASPLPERLTQDPQLREAVRVAQAR